ncbi:hypothetical protein [Desertivirga brevis]|uniref:hypothetical protein n=1 Tax=Desertivirga brevis TaxID=2810310 RepID=UPI001A96AB8F|nr:hypothetical protein [Pedobacter sp. SYSU D00873]
MNYILHLNGFYRKANSDEKLTPYHLSLYLAIFQQWNAYFFRKSFPVTRRELMRLSKIGSSHTYYRCLKQLHEWGYINYIPSPNRAIASTISCVVFHETSVTFATNTGSTSATTTGSTSATTTGSTSDTPLVAELHPFIKLNKTFKNTLTIKNIKKFFEENYSDGTEAVKFYNHYQANGWMMGRVEIVDWEAAARKWIAGADNFSKPAKRKTSRSAKIISITNPTTRKRYDEPL